MQIFSLKPGSVSPEIYLSPDENIFFIKGTSAPEDVRAIYYPVIEWIRDFADRVVNEKSHSFSKENPLKFQVDLEYFNSSSAKFLYDIFMELKRLLVEGVPLLIEWFYDEEDIDLKEAGMDIGFLAEMVFTYVPKQK